MKSKLALVIICAVSSGFLNGFCSQDGGGGFCFDTQPKAQSSREYADILLENVGTYRVYVVFVDNKKVATLEKGDTYPVQIPSGVHVIRWDYWDSRKNGYTYGCMMSNSYQPGRKYHLSCGD